jgi:hypothetical protein
MMNSRASLKTTYLNGKTINYQGAVGFDGSPRGVVWGGFFEPFMFDAAKQSLEWVIATCRDRHLDASEYLSEAMARLDLLVARTYEEMVRTDQILRGGGHPDSVSPVRVASKVDAMKKRIADLAVALTHHGRTASTEQEVLNLRPGLWGICRPESLWRRCSSVRSNWDEPDDASRRMSFRTKPSGGEVGARVRKQLAVLTTASPDGDSNGGQDRTRGVGSIIALLTPLDQQSAQRGA